MVQDAKKRKTELLLPAKDLEVLKTAVRYGADAVYIGGEAYGLRAKARNFSPEEMAEGIRYAHERGVKVYVTANILAHNSDLAGAEQYFGQLAEMKPDAILVADPGMFMLAQKACPEIPLHISTQANNTNYETFNFWFRMGAERVVCARELSLVEIAQIREHIPQDREIEAFVHGAMCISYSGRCLLSNYFTGRDANHGACTHPCRWKYAVMEESRPGVYLPVEENERGTFVFNSRDYRQAIDDYNESEELYRSRIPEYQEAIRKCTYRRFTTGFYYGRPNEEAMVYDSNTYVNEAVFLGIVEEITPHGRARIMQRNKFCVGDRIEVMKPGGRDIPIIVNSMYNQNGERIYSAPHPQEIIDLELVTEEGVPFRAEEGDVLRAVKQRTED